MSPHPPPLQVGEGIIRAAPRSEAKAVQGLFGFLFGQGRVQLRRRRPGSSTRLSKDNRVCVLPVGLWVLASPLAGESVMKELSRVFWKLMVSASECGPLPHSRSFQAKSTQICFGGKLGVGVEINH